MSQDNTPSSEGDDVPSAPSDDPRKVLEYERSFKNFFVNKEVQYAIIQYFVLIFAAMVACSIGIVYYFWHKYSEAWVDLGMLDSSTFFDFLLNKQIMLATFTVVFSLALLSFFLVDWVRYSHKIVGPIYHLEKHMQAMIDAEKLELKEVTFRDTDKFQNLAATFNTLIKKVNESKKN